jgi:hypothetical protein
MRIKIPLEVEAVRGEQRRERKGGMMRAVRKTDDIQKKEIKQAKKHSIVHQFIVLSRKIGVEMVPG